ncbi:hypothetical protein HWV62_29753 [Athelia sp. TMB]|nr:hypothetical protein HWV62_29753 [Athelia sp. TMB]
MIVKTFLLGAALILIYKLAVEVLRRVSSPLNDLPGPKPSHWFFGNFREIGASNHAVVGKWAARWGPTVSFYSVFRDKALCTIDHKAVNHVLTHSDIYQKPASQRDRVALALGNGVLLAEGDAHRQQRKVLLRDVWSGLIADSKDAPTRVEATIWLSRATLDIIGQAGFNYDFSSLDTTKEPGELMKAFGSLFKTPGLGGLRIARLFVPISRFLPTAQMKRLKLAQKAMLRIGAGLLADAQAAQASGDKSGAQGRDLLSLLVHANTAEDIPPSQRLSDADVIAQVPTFLIAGHETTANATAWALFRLTQAPAVQRALRAELLQVPTENPSMEQLNGLSYLDYVVREVLRLHAPVPLLMREAVEADVIPLDTPVVDKYGRMRDSIRINKGDTVLMSVKTINASPKTWGPDALEFKPERWESIPESAHHVPGVWANQLTFSTGPRACIGYKFSIVETKALLFALVRAFDFELAVPGNDIQGSASTLVQRPFVVSEREKGVQMPLLIKPYVQ